MRYSETPISVRPHGKLRKLDLTDGLSHFSEWKYEEKLENQSVNLLS